MSQLSPDLFRPENISPETAKFNEGVHKLLSSLPPTYARPVEVTRQEREEGKGFIPIKKLDILEDRFVPGPAGDILIRVYTPQTIRGVYLHIHGGGFVLGRAHYQDGALKDLADHCQMVTVSVDYRLAPEHPYPAGADDCEAAALWLIKNVKKEFGTEHLLIGGESAGANLSAVTLLRLRDRHDFNGFLGANLVYGIYDLSLTPSSRNWGEKRNLVLTTKLMEWFNTLYAPSNDLKDPGLSPLFADLSNLPPALFTVGTLDPLLDDSLFMCSRWMAAGNEAEVAVYSGGIHGFNAFPLEISRLANAKIREFLKGRLTWLSP
jgi:acetyl esterase/lipase